MITLRLLNISMEMFQSNHFLHQKCIMYVEKHSICAFRMLHTGLRDVQFPPPLKLSRDEQHKISSLRDVQFPPPLKHTFFLHICIIGLRDVQFPPPLKRLRIGIFRVQSLRDVQFPPPLKLFKRP